MNHFLINEKIVFYLIHIFKAICILFILPSVCRLKSLDVNIFFSNLWFTQGHNVFTPVSSYNTSIVLLLDGPSTVILTQNTTRVLGRQGALLVPSIQVIQHPRHSVIPRGRQRLTHVVPPVQCQATYD